VGRNAQVRRFRRDLDKKLNHTGPSGEPNPNGNRAYRRSKEGNRQLREMLEEIRQLMKIKTGEVSDN
jgi:hypothetical protein